MPTGRRGKGESNRDGGKETGGGDPTFTSTPSRAMALPSLDGHASGLRGLAAAQGPTPVLELALIKYNRAGAGDTAGSRAEDQSPSHIHPHFTDQQTKARESSGYLKGSWVARWIWGWSPGSFPDWGRQTSHWLATKAWNPGRRGLRGRAVLSGKGHRSAMSARGVGEGVAACPPPAARLDYTRCPGLRDASCPSR